MTKPRPIPADASVTRIGDLVFVSYRVDGKARVTDAEAETIALAMDDLTNAEIAERRGVSLRTIANQLASAFRKLGVSSRYELKSRIQSASKPRR